MAVTVTTELSEAQVKVLARLFRIQGKAFALMDIPHDPKVLEMSDEDTAKGLLESMIINSLQEALLTADVSEEDLLALSLAQITAAKGGKN